MINIRSIKIFGSMLSVIVLLLLIIQLITGTIFGKQYDSYKDYSCCNNKILLLHHYYDYHLFWIAIYNGYDVEAYKSKETNNCYTLCSD